MKTLIFKTILTACVAVLLMSAVAQTAPVQITDSNSAPAAPGQPVVAPMLDAPPMPPDEGALNGSEALPAQTVAAPTQSQSATSATSVQLAAPETATTDFIPSGEA